MAVAYFGKGASRLLPLTAGSRLVVDASECAVASGQTCPADLIKLVARGVIELHKLACPAFRRLPPRKFGALTLKLKI